MRVPRIGAPRYSMRTALIWVSKCVIQDLLHTQTLIDFDELTSSARIVIDGHTGTNPNPLLADSLIKAIDVADLPCEVSHHKVRSHAPRVRVIITLNCCSQRMGSGVCVPSLGGTDRRTSPRTKRRYT